MILQTRKAFTNVTNARVFSEKVSAKRLPMVFSANRRKKTHRIREMDFSPILTLMKRPF